VYFVAEGGQLFQNRVLAAKKALEIPDGDAALELVHAAPSLGLNDKDACAILKAIEVQRKRSAFGKLPLVVVIDTLARTMKGAKEDETGFGTFIANCEIITGEFGGLAVAVHHSGKDASKGLRGWSGLGAALENEWRFARLPNGRRQVVVDKVRDGQDGIGWEFEIESVKLGENKHKRPVTTCVVKLLTEPKPAEEADKVSAPAKKRQPKNRPQFEQAFNEAILNHRVMRSLTAPANVLTPSVACVDREHVRAEFYKRCSEEAQDTKKKAFVRVLEALFQEYPQATDEAGNVWIWKVKP
jgi:hypothetical protein